MFHSSRFFRFARLLLLGVCAACHAMDYYFPDKFSLFAGPASVEGYPVRIIDGSFTSSTGGYILVPPGHLLTDSWGVSTIAWGVGEAMQPAPDSLHLRWFAYPEDKFYEGHFALPQQRIHSLLQDGYWDRHRQEHATYAEFTVCILPQGGVAVWLGNGNSVLLGRYQAQPLLYDWTRYSTRSESRAETVRNLLAHLTATDADVRALLAAGPPSPAKWDEYLKTYPWKVEVTERTGQRVVPLRLYHYEMHYVNAEYMRYPKDKDDVAPFLQLLLEPSLKPVPKEFLLYVENEHEERYELRIDSLEEQEAMAAFRELRAQSIRPMTLHVEVDGVYKKATLTLRHDYGQVVLQKAVVEIYRED